MVESKKSASIFAEINSELPEDELSKLFLKTIFEKSVDVSDPLYKHSFTRTFKVNFDIGGHKGYQIYEPNKYTYKYGEFLDDPDFTFIYKDIEYIREKLRGDKSRPALARDKNNVLQVCRKETLFTADTKVKVGNAQLFIVRIPFFKEIIEDLGASQQTLPLRDEPDEPISPVKEGEIASLMKEMLIETGNMPEDLYQKNFKGHPMKINWEIIGNKAYQNFEETGYSYEIGKHIEDADVTLKFPNPIHAKRFLSKIPGNYAARIVDKKLDIYYKKPVLSVIFKDRDASAIAIGRFPFYTELGKIEIGPQVEEIKDARENYGHYISVNIPIGDFENMPVPYKVFEHFINKASNIVLRTCPCRERYECKNHSIELGCIFMGDDTKNMVLPEGHGYVATKEQALQHLNKAMAEGLVPLLGRNVAEAEGGHGVEDTGKFLSGCFCCECCCIGVKYAQYGVGTTGTGMGGDNTGPIEGMTIKVDEEKCIGCGACVEVCPFKFRILEDGKSSVDPKRCVGCGRCLNECPQGAISFDVEDPELIDKFIEKIESIVDVEDQSSKT